MRSFDDLERGAYMIGRPVAIPKRIIRPPVRWEDIEIGMEFDQLEYTVRAEDAAAYADIVHDEHPWYADETLPNGPYAPPTISDNDVLNCIGTRFLRSGRLHTVQEFEFINPLTIGATVRSRAKVVDKYMHRERPYYIVECLTETSDGTPIMRSRATLVI